MLAALFITVVLLALAWIIVRAGAERRVAPAAPPAGAAPLAPRRPRMTPVDGTMLPAGVYPFDVSGWTQEPSTGDDASDSGGDSSGDTSGDSGGDSSRRD
jgi:hypothetical protein